jgi:hypothetical protein
MSDTDNTMIGALATGVIALGAAVYFGISQLYDRYSNTEKSGVQQERLYEAGTNDCPRTNTMNKLEMEVKQ